MEKDLELSFSEVVSKVDGNIEIGKELLIEIANERKNIDERIYNIKQELTILENHKDLISQTTLNIIQHLNLRYPTYIKLPDNNILKIDVESCSVLDNVI